MRYTAITVPGEYRPFPTVDWRNAVQRRFEIPTLVRLLALPAGGDVLEVGCGPGVAFEPLDRLLRPASLVGIDVDAAHVATAQSERTASAVYRADVRALPFADASFDLVVDFGTCHHISEPERALVEIARVLRPGGLLVHETALAQALSHPTRFHGGRLPWASVPALESNRRAGPWATRRRV